MGTVAGFIAGFNGGTRVNRFKVTGGISSEFHIRAATLPESVIGEAAISWQGRSISYGGDRVYAPWNITVLDDTNGLHASFHAWSNQINAHTTNKAQPGLYPGAKTFTITPLDVSGSDIGGRSFTLNNCWPMMVGPIQLDMGQDNTFATFAVSLMYSDFTF